MNWVGLDLDVADNWIRLNNLCAEHHPALIIIDTYGRCTTKKMHIVDEVNAFFDPIIDIAIKHGTTILALTHMNKEGDILGLRVKGVARALWMLHAPENAAPDATSAWRSRGTSREPPALGLTLHEEGAEYDWDPPSPDKDLKGGQRGRPRGSREEARAWIMERLQERNHLQATRLQEDAAEAGVCVKNTFWRAVEELEEAGEILRDGKPFVLHLCPQNCAAY